MRIDLVVPSAADPAHRRVAGALAREYRGLGHRVRVIGRPSELAGELCHIQFFSRGLGWLRRARLPRRARVLLTHQGASTRFLEHPALFSRLAARAEAVTAVSSAGLGELKASFPGAAQRWAAVPNGTDIPSGPSVKRGGFVLTVGRIAAYKGLDLLAMGLPALLEEFPELRWTACGPDQSGGAMREFVRRLGIEGRVRFEGAVGPARVSRLMRECAVFAQPSRSENHPMALLEAMAAGCAVAASRAGGIPEIVEHGRSGLLFPPGDFKACRRTLRRLAKDASLRRRLGRGARDRAADFSWGSAARAYLRLIRG